MSLTAIATAEWARASLAFAACGAISGAAATTLLVLLGAAGAAWDPILPGWLIALKLSPITLLPGAAFGLIVGVALRRRRIIAARQVALYVVAATISYYAAVRLALALDRPIGNLALTGMIAGLFGSVLLTGLSAAFLRGLRRSKIWLPLLAGCLFGALLQPALAIKGLWGFLILFVPWQAAYAAALAAALPPAESASSATRQE